MVQAGCIDERPGWGEARGFDHGIAGCASSVFFVSLGT